MKVLKLLLYNKESKLIDKKFIKDFKISEDYIIEQCKIKYATDEPCIIYRTLVINGTHIMLDNYFRKLLKSEECMIDISKLPSNIVYAVDFPDNVIFLKVSI